MRKVWTLVMGGIFSLLMLSSGIIPIVFHSTFENEWTSYTEPGIYDANEQLEICGGQITLEAELWHYYTIELNSSDYLVCTLGILISEVYCFLSLERVWIIDEFDIYSTTASISKLVEENQFMMVWECPYLPSDSIVDVVVKIWVRWDHYYLIARDCSIQTVA